MFNMLFYDLIKSIGSDDNLKNKVVDLKPLFKVMFEQGFISGSKDGVEKYIESKEFKIDWSQAPEWANWWAMDENKNTSWIYSELEQPYTSDIFLRWFAVGKFDSADAPSFGYTGDWRESLRKRPQ